MGGALSPPYLEDKILLFFMPSTLSGDVPFHCYPSRYFWRYHEPVLDRLWKRWIDIPQIKRLPVQKQCIYLKTERYRLIKPALRFDSHHIEDGVPGLRPRLYRGDNQSE